MLFFRISKMANSSRFSHRKLYSEIVKPKEPSMMSVFGISLAQEYKLQLLPGKKIKPDGNCIFSWAFDQIINRQVRY